VEGLEGSPIGASIKQGRGINQIKISAFLLPFIGQLGVSHAYALARPDERRIIRQTHKRIELHQALTYEKILLLGKSDSLPNKGNKSWQQKQKHQRK